MNQINWKKELIIVFIIGGLVLLGVYFLVFKNVKKIPEAPKETVTGFPPGFTLEDLKKTKIPEKGEKLGENVAVPQEVLPSAPEATSNIRLFELKGENGQLTPTDFRAYQNDILNIKLTAIDKDYDFFLEGYNLSIKANKGKTKTIEFQALNIGRYLFYCSLCFSKDKPAGQIIVVPR